MDEKQCASCGRPLVRVTADGPKKYLRKRYCSLYCAHESHRRPVMERLTEAIEFDPFGGCWLWTKALSNDGYGKLKVDGMMIYAHRVAWGLFRGEPPPDAQILHRCDVRLCVNPAHLFLGDHAANMADMQAKGRAGRSRNTRRRLTVEQHEIIRSRYTPGHWTNGARSLARELGFTAGSIRRAARLDRLNREGR